jgi:hypothetical protein
LIYYYFGKSKEEMMITAVTHLGRELFGLSDERLRLWQQGMIHESVIQSRALLLAAPYCYTFYVLRKDQGNSIGEALRKCEVEFRDKLKKFFPHLSDDQREAVAVFLLGLANSVGISENGIRAAVDVLQNFVQRAKSQS